MVAFCVEFWLNKFSTNVSLKDLENYDWIRLADDLLDRIEVLVYYDSSSVRYD